MCFRSTTEYYCKQDMDIYQLYPRLSTLSHTDSQGKITVINNTQLPSKSSSGIEESKENGNSELHMFAEPQMGKVGEHSENIKCGIREIAKKSCSTVKDYFLPRVNSSFTLDLLACVEHFKLTRECVTNNKTWHTVQELVISRLD